MTALEKLIEKYDRDIRKDVADVIEARMKSIADQIKDFDRRLKIIEKLLARPFEK